MGYTQSWTPKRSFTDEEWAEAVADIGDILKYCQHVADIPLANGLGERGTSPEFNDEFIRFNGVGDDCHDSFEILRHLDNESWDFTKTDHKPYNVAVTACLCYLSTVSETHHVVGDGSANEYTDGLDMARKALPQRANILDYPMGKMQKDRWTGPWISGQDGSGYAVHFCVNGFGYVERLKRHAWYRFDSHLALAQWLDARKVVEFSRGGRFQLGAVSMTYDRVESNIWNPTGCFDDARHARIAKAQGKALAALFPVPAKHAFDPPAFVRPMDFPRPEEQGKFCYDLADIFARHGVSQAA